jgi:hypothetical protein
MKFPHTKHKILELLGDGKAKYFSEIAGQMTVKELGYSTVFLQKDGLIAKTDEGQLYLTDDGKKCLDILRAKEAFYRHNFNHGYRCLRCGINRKSISGNLYWYDGDDKQYKSAPSCVPYETHGHNSTVRASANSAPRS